MGKTVYLLTGDIGGTNSRMGLYDPCKGSSDDPLCVKYYRNEEHLTSPETKGLFETNIIRPFLQHCWESTSSLEPIEEVDIVACLACAGPVGNNRVIMSNLGNLEIDGNSIQNSTDKHVGRIQLCSVINDFVAQGYGCLTLKPNEVKELTPNSHKMLEAAGAEAGPKVCVGAGTGLGECYLTPTSFSYQCFPSEGGHTEFNPRSELEIRLRAFLMSKFSQASRISTERVVSGKGLANVYEFLASEFPKQVDSKIHEEFLAAGDMQGKVVAVNANDKEGKLCKQAMDIMISAYGSEVGCAALKWIPTGGLYVTGGLTPKNIHHIEGPQSEFMKAYHDKGRVSPILQTIPLFAVMVEDLGVRGAHKWCAMIYEQDYLNNTDGATAASNKKTKTDGPIWALSVIAAATVGYLLARKAN